MTIYRESRNMNSKAARCCCLAKNKAFLHNLGQNEAIVSLVHGRHHVGFDQDQFTK